jgi:hypothetical protein
MYSLAKNKYFCCPTGYFGVLPVSGSSGLCELDVNGLSTSRIASLVTTPTGSGSGGGASTTGSAGNGAAGGGSSGSSGGSGGNGSGGDGSGGGSSGVLGNAPGTSPNGISAGAIAGIAIGGVILLAICFAGILWVHRKSLRKTPSPKPEPIYDQGFAPQAQHPPAAAAPETAMPPPQYSRSPGQPELGGSQMVEMPTTRS